MALELAIKHGKFDVSYWRWLEINKSDLYRRAHCVLGGWENQADREAYPNEPTCTHEFDWIGDDYPFDLVDLNKPGVNDLSIAYSKCKDGDSPFAEAIDLL